YFHKSTYVARSCAGRPRICVECTRDGGKYKHVVLLRAEEGNEECEGGGRSKINLPRRNFLHLAAGAGALPAVSRIAFAQAYPLRPVRIVVGFAPAGATDIMARLIGQWLSERLG